MSEQTEKKEFVSVADAMKAKANKRTAKQRDYVAVYHINDKRSVAVGGKASTVQGAIEDARVKFEKSGLLLPSEADISIIFKDE